VADVMWRYYVDFIWAPSTVVIVTVLTARSIDWIVLCVLGIVGGSLIEYLVHRFILHGIMWHGTHERHHTHPDEYVVFPVYALPLFFFCVFWIVPYSIFAGFLIWFIWFVVWHHFLHHRNLDRRPWIKRYAAWHNRHHQGMRANYGISTPMWDLIFGSYVPARIGAQ
jgi:sterol desaturase/sphingolipid hydroxylase (fatty acid hydroxylase superfamily)